MYCILNGDVYGPLVQAGELGWRCCVRLQDKKAAAELTLQHLHRWSFEHARDAVSMCMCHLSPKVIFTARVAR